MGPFDRFNDRAKRVLALAQDEAIRFNHNYIGTEHLLLGLLREGEGVAATVLRSLGAELGKLRSAVEFMVGRSESTTSPSEIILSPRTKKVIELALDEANKLGHSHVGTEHLLLGLVREGEGIASGVLASLGITLEQARHQVIATLGQQDPLIPGAGMVAERGPDPRGSLLDAQGTKRDWYCEDVLSGRLEVKRLHEDDLVLAFHHPSPDYDIHAVVIPKKHVASLMADEAADPALLVAMIRAVQSVARTLYLDKVGFRLEANAGAPGVTPHLHWHVIGPGLPPPRRAAGGYASLPQLKVGEGGWALHAGPRQAGPFDRFSDDAKRVLALAQDEARRMQHNYIGTEHLLPAFIREGISAASTALTEAGLTLDAARAGVESTIGRGEAPSPPELTLTPRVKKIIELAIARAGEGRKVRAGHLLIALIDEGGGIAVQILMVRADVARIRARLVELLGQ